MRRVTTRSAPTCATPPGSSHAPFSEQGCRILVKLRQFAADDLAQFAIDTRDPSLWSEQRTLPLQTFAEERVGMQREGLRRKILPIRGEWQDNYMYSILDEDWFS